MDISKKHEFVSIDTEKAKEYLWNPRSKEGFFCITDDGPIYGTVIERFNGGQAYTISNPNDQYRHEIQYVLMPV